jgi:hypothetical protein
MTGDQTGDQSANPKGVQNSLKNNLCSGGTTTTLRAEDFVALQRTAEQMGVSFGFTGFGADRVEHIPVDRSNLAHLFATPDNQQIGEGARVQIVALVDFSPLRRQGERELRATSQREPRHSYEPRSNSGATTAEAARSRSRC